MREIKLGDKVRCKITGFTGTAVAKTEFINGCVQWSVVPRVKDARKQITMPEEIGIDEQSLEIVPLKKKKIKKSDNGGAMNRNCSRRNY